MIDLDTLARHLRDLPDLAERAAPVVASGRVDRVVHTTGSRLPAGVDLHRIDVDHGRQHPDLLTRVSQCVRVVCEEHDVWTLPPLGPEGTETWTSECGWLLTTLPTWSTDEWCTEWIGTEIDGPRGVWSRLVRMVDASVDPTCCPICGVRVTAYGTRTVAVATCPECERVVGMKARRMLTTVEVADALGISVQAVRKRVRAGKLHAERTSEGWRIGAEQLPPGSTPRLDLDSARHKLGIPAT